MNKHVYGALQATLSRGAGDPSQVGIKVTEELGLTEWYWVDRPPREGWYNVRWHNADMKAMIDVATSRRWWNGTTWTRPVDIDPNVLAERQPPMTLTPYPNAYFEWQGLRKDPMSIYSYDKVADMDWEVFS